VDLVLQGGVVLDLQAVLDLDQVEVMVVLVLLEGMAEEEDHHLEEATGQRDGKDGQLIHLKEAPAAMGEDPHKVEKVTAAVVEEAEVVVGVVEDLVGEEEGLE